ncbi:MAG: hypothetical protein JNJ77_00635 [Planctomycetia bacterium]|nr:hypothetical protein [Planctomycetia bacterium]
MTIELKLPAELEILARARADESFNGDMQVMLETVLRDYLASDGYDEELDQLLLEAVNTPLIPMPQDWRELIKKKQPG